MNSGDIYILGIFCYFRDSSACLLKNGEIIAMAEEERFSREKHTGDFPEHAIRYCLNSFGLSIKDLHSVAYGWRPLPFIAYQGLHFIKNFPRSLNLLRDKAAPIPFRQKIFRILSIPSKIREIFGESPTRFYYISHHLAHAYSCFYPSPFKNAAIFTADGFGEISTTGFFYGSGNNIERLGSVQYPNSLGLFYSGITELLGFRPDSDEYKVMGLCAYGKNTKVQLFQEILRPDGELSFRLDQSYFDFMTHGTSRWMSSKGERAIGGKRKYEDEYDQSHFDIARSAQTQLEAVAEHLGRNLQLKTGSKNICVAGGVAQNILMNRVLLDKCGFENIFVPPTAYDGGISLGSALAAYHQKFGGVRTIVLNSADWGPKYSNEECVIAANEKGIELRYESHMSECISRLVMMGKIIGYFSGRMEIGPRALGFRSIFADPRRKDIKEILNSRIKNREFFRPFAAMVTLEDQQIYFDTDIESPFMTWYGKVKTPDILPGITHRDGTCRIQTVKKSINPAIHELLITYKRLTGVPVLINTSFNENEPIVCTPKEAIDCFMRTKMDALIFNHNLIVEKS